MVASEFNIKKKNTNLIGVALTTRDGRIKVFYGADDGSDDKVMTFDEFCQNFEIINEEE